MKSKNCTRVIWRRTEKADRDKTGRMKDWNNKNTMKITNKSDMERLIVLKEPVLSIGENNNNYGKNRIECQLAS